MRVALIVILASLLLLIGWISMRMARNPEPRSRTRRRDGYIPYDGSSGNHHGHGGADGGSGDGGGSDGGGGGH
jgi:uncharacterized membrane protein YgcG